MYNKTIIRFSFCDVQPNNQGLGKGYQPQPSALADNPYLDSSNDCLLLLLLLLLSLLLLV